MNSLQIIKDSGMLDPHEFWGNFVRPLEKLGYTLLRFKSIEFLDEKTEADSGVHIFLWKDNHPPRTDSHRKEIRELLTADDDSQPNSCYTSYLGEIWHFIPYYA